MSRNHVTSADDQYEILSDYDKFEESNLSKIFIVNNIYCLIPLVKISRVCTKLLSFIHFCYVLLLLLEYSFISFLCICSLATFPS